MMKRKLLCITPIEHIGDLKQRIEKDFDLIYLPDPLKEDVIQHNDAEIIFTNPNKTKVFLGEELLESFSKLKVITTASTGTVHIDKEYCQKTNIDVISITKELDTLRKVTSTAEFAFTLTLAAVRNLIPAVESVNRMEWDYEQFIGRQLNCLTIGIIGYGRLGKMYAKFTDGFDANILVCDPYNEGEVHSDGYSSCSIQKIFEQSDVIALHIHAQDNEKLIGEKLLNFCKKNLILINTSRGEIVDEEFIIRFGKQNEEFKYFSDVLTNEYLGLNQSDLYKYSLTNDNFVITPHIGGMSIDAQILAYGRAFEMLREYVSNNS